MGRGRSKAKQAKVARDLKYSSQDMDIERLAKELHGEANGTMARNPWLKINPLKDIAESSTDGNKLVFGGLGKLISWTWLLGGVAFTIYGFIILWRQKEIERMIGVIALFTVASSWLITLISIGDHRFRLPIMGMSLFLQAVGIRTLFKGGKPPMVDGPALR